MNRNRMKCGKYNRIIGKKDGWVCGRNGEEDGTMAA